MNPLSWSGAANLTSLLAVALIGCQPGGERSLSEGVPAVDPKAVDSSVDASADPTPGPFPDLADRVAPIGEAVEQARMDLRADSGTLAADSAFLGFRRDLQEPVRKVAGTLDDPDFQARIYPEGRVAFMRRRERERQPEDWRPTPAEVAEADSLLDFLVSRGLWVERAEGDTYFEASEAFVLDRLGPYLTGAMRDFLRMRVEEQVRPAAADASIMIPLDDLAARMVSAERFLEANPGSPVRGVVESRRRWYLAVYLGGLPNTRPFDRRTGQLRPEWRDSMERYVAEYGSTESGVVVSTYLDVLADSDFARNPRADTIRSRLWDSIRPVPFP